VRFPVLDRRAQRAANLAGGTHKTAQWSVIARTAITA
jgi:hypothetical protein